MFFPLSVEVSEMRGVHYLNRFSVVWARKSKRG